LNPEEVPIFERRPFVPLIVKNHDAAEV